MIAQPLASSFWGRSLVSVEWQKSCHLVYALDPAALAAELPPGLSLDLWEQRAVVALSLWSSKNLKVLGVGFSAQLDSTDAALRFCAREGNRRGLVPVLEDSSSTYAALAARALFKEPTRHTPARVHCEEREEELLLRYQLERGGSHAVQVVVEREATLPAQHTLAHFLLERPYTYVCSKQGTLLRHDLEHPPLATHVVREHTLSLDFGALYGQSWAFLNGERPTAVIVADGAMVRASLPE